MNLGFRVSAGAGITHRVHLVPEKQAHARPFILVPCNFKPPPVGCCDASTSGQPQPGSCRVPLPVQTHERFYYPAAVSRGDSLTDIRYAHHDSGTGSLPPDTNHRTNSGTGIGDRVLNQVLQRRAHLFLVSLEDKVITLNDRARLP
ncbi:hypothetical protein QF050_003010 [Arthrobacter sp. SLBN-112]|nr:hypothetical protein [Arthrobacter sp. SLBN-112]MDQ0801371.1 hypothetical protein [Arthrobacter sp. SLBN-112]